MDYRIGECQVLQWIMELMNIGIDEDASSSIGIWSLVIKDLLQLLIS